MATIKSKVDYLKRYGYKPEDSSAKKKIKRVKKVPHAGKVIPRSKIVDDDFDINAVAPNEFDDGELETGEDAPQIEGIVDDRPMELQKMEAFASNKWRAFGDDDNEVSLSGNHERRRHDSDSDHAGHSRNDSDVSPPRKRHDSDESPPRRREQQDSDASPPRRRGQHDSDASPPRRRGQQDSDASPPRRRGQQDSDASPPRRRGQQDSDASPPRRRGQQDSDASPPRRRGQQDTDASPPRRRRQQDSDASPPRRRGQQDSDASPPRRRRQQNSGASPPRQKMRRSRDSSPRRKMQHSRSSPSRNKGWPNRTGHDSDTSPPRRKVKRDCNASPPREMRKGAGFDRTLGQPIEQANQDKRIHAKVASDYFPTRRKNHTSDSDSSPPRRASTKHRESQTVQKKTLDGKKAGLQDAKTLRLENEAARERERKLFDKMDEAVSGKNSKTILRDRSTGLRRNLEEERQKQMEEDAVKAEREAKYNQWGKGVKQTEMQQYTLQQTLKEISKPLARYENDEDLDKVLRDQDREGDPMLAFIKKKKTVIGGKELPKYNGPQPPPNRFGIMPGYRWDGVDRSNGFEKARFARLSSKVASEEEAYKWSVEDM